MRSKGEGKMKRTINVFLAVALVVCAGLANAQGWPSRPVKVIVSTPAGTSPDIIGRLFSDRLNRAFGQGFFVENVTGAGGLIASRSVAKAEPDGYTLFFAGAGALILDPFTIKDIGYDPERDFTLIAMIYSEGSLGVAVNPEVLPVKTLREFMAYAKKKPGSISYGSTNVTYTMLFGRWLQKLTDTDMVAVNYKVQGQLIQDGLAGRTQMMIVSPPEIESFLKAGKLRLIAVDGLKPQPLLPGVETIATTLPGFHLSGLGVLAGPAGLPASITQRLNSEMDKIVRSPEYGKLMAQMGFGVEGAGTQQSIVSFVRERRAYWSDVMKGLNVVPQ
jgi:tripartite-type tricarboxylate transporter receptor subunit TctC